MIKWLWRCSKCGAVNDWPCRCSWCGDFGGGEEDGRKEKTDDKEKDGEETSPKEGEKVE